MKICEYLIEKSEYLIKNFGDKIMKAFEKDTYAKQKFPDATAENIVNIWSRIDIKNHYLQWIIRQYIRGDFRIEDAPRVARALRGFDQKKRSLEIKDIGQYKTLSDLEDALETPEQQSKRQQKLQIKHEGSEVMLKGPDCTILKLKTQEAACYYGKGTRWCTAANEDNMFDDYDNNGPLYFVMGSDGRKYQFHLESRQLMDEKDNPVEASKLSEKYPTLKKFFERFIEPKVLEEGTANIVLWYTRNVSGHKPEFEKQMLYIFKHDVRNFDNLYKYASTIKKGPIEGLEEIILNKHPERLIGMSRDLPWIEYVVGKKPWIEFKNHMLSHNNAALFYSLWLEKKRLDPRIEKKVVEDKTIPLIQLQHYFKRFYSPKRWPGYEQRLLSALETSNEHIWSINYIRTIYSDLIVYVNSVKTRIPSIEKVIFEEPSLWTPYVKIFGERIPELEEQMLKNSPSASVAAGLCDYSIGVIRGPWLEAEDVIAKYTHSAYNYAVKNFKERWKKGEPTIFQDYSKFMGYVSRLSPREQQEIRAEYPELPW